MLPAPTRAPIIVLGPRPTKANFATVAAVSKVLRPCDQALSREPPTIASSVAPAAEPRDGKRDGKIESATLASAITVGTPTNNAAAKIAGQNKASGRRDGDGARIDRSQRQAGFRQNKIADADDRQLEGVRRHAAEL